MTRVGVIGCGAIAQRVHIPLLQAAGAELTAFASGSRASAEAAASMAPGSTVHDDWRDLALAPDVDAVVIASPNAMHAVQAIACIEAGKHVLVEKPFTVTVADADAVLAAAAGSGVVVMTAHNARFASPVVAIRDALVAGAIGRVTAVRASFAHAGVQNWSATSEWFTDPARSGGGALIDLGVHLIDTLRWVLDDELTSVSASVDPSQGCELDALVLFTTVSGVTGTLHAGWRAPQGRDLSLWLQGETATLVLDELGPRVLRPGLPAESLALGEEDTVQAAFLRAVEAGVAIGPDARDGRAAVAVVQAAYESARTGRRISLS